MTLPAIFFVRLARQEKALHIARLTEMHFSRGQRVVVVVADDVMATALDRYLWAWKKDSFLPHKVMSTVGEFCDDAVVISTVEFNPNRATVLICATPCSPDFLKNFQQIYDFAETYDPHLAEAARERFRLFRQQGFDPQLEPPATDT
ncbi:DNA polymerase III subunit chi [Pelovirga terrestris]|uniref:DNA polymerase III subunit chi n=1 Tax=Pelovirga terrestris TaxID=2771352 RepID=A0A8J6QVR0_9BACT|nr:DNA polymerase III subunit chi [Pelovirga terrestris]MBD1399171.1 DNA polymerase III subunit chi [Pelovirga terrestris]